MAEASLRAEVTAFLDVISDELAALSGRSASDHRRDAVADAASLVAAVIDSDGRATDAELWAYTDALGPLLDPPLLEPPARLREARVTAGKAAWLATPSTLFDLLVRADQRDRSRRSHRYYELALALAHAVAAADQVPSTDEIAAIDRFRSVMLAAVDAAGVPRPGVPDNRPQSSGSPTPSQPAPTQAAGAAAGPAPTVTTSDELRRTAEELLAELDELVGLDKVKAEVRRLTSLLQIQQRRASKGLPTFETSHHIVFTGNPGTGKTTVARLLSQLYRALGVLSKGHLVETDRSSLVAGYVGQTAVKTHDVLTSGLGGMVLIDEAYALARGGENDFGREAIDTLVKFMEDHRSDLAVVAAGYPAEMQTLIEANPGLKSRFTRTLHFADYSDDELLTIFLKLGDKHRYHASEGAVDAVKRQLAEHPRGVGFGNARYMRNLFDAAVAHHAERVAPLDEPTDEQLTTLVARDIVAIDG